VDDTSSLADRFDADRPRLRSVAYRILGNPQDAEDAVQEAWLRLSATDATEIQNLAGWLTTVVSRICLNMLRGRQRRPSTSIIDPTGAVRELSEHAAVSPEEQVILADTLGVALLVVLEQLSPAERIVFVLHDLFSISFEEVAQILGKSSDACRQLASRARRRVRAADDPSADPQRQHEIVVAFLAASKSGDFQQLLTLLSPDVELEADALAVAMGAPARLRGAHEVASLFSGGARAARTALLDGMAGLVWAQGGQTKVAFEFTVAEGKVVRIDMIADEDVLGEMQIERLGRKAAV
jgi:RNA polymerase sigma factor (sigma-70 family)